MESLLPIAVLLFFALCVCGVILGLTTLIGPKNPVAAKLAPYECGVTGEGTARAPFKIDFYLIAVLFLLFDVEAAFFLPWALVYKETLSVSGALFWAMVTYLGLMVIALVYILKKDALKLR